MESTDTSTDVAVADPPVETATHNLQIPVPGQEKVISNIIDLLKGRYRMIQFERIPPSQGTLLGLSINCLRSSRANKVYNILTQWTARGIPGRTSFPLPIKCAKTQKTVTVVLVKEKFNAIRKKVLASQTGTAYEYNFYGVEKEGKQIVPEQRLAEDLVSVLPEPAAPKVVVQPPALGTLNAKSSELVELLHEVTLRVIGFKHHGLTDPRTNKDFNIRISFRDHVQTKTMAKVLEEYKIASKITESSKPAGSQSILMLINHPIDYYKVLFKDLLQKAPIIHQLPIGTHTVTVKRTDPLRGNATQEEKDAYKNRNKPVKQVVAKVQPPAKPALTPKGKVMISQEVILGLLDGLDEDVRLKMLVKSLTPKEIMKLPEIASEIRVLIAAAKLKAREELHEEGRAIIAGRKPKKK